MTYAAQDVTVDNLKFDEYIGGAYPPDLYRATTIARPLPGVGAVTDADVARYHEEGYLVVADVLTPDEVRGAIDGIRDLINGKSPEFKGVQFELGAKDEVVAATSERRHELVRKLIDYVEFDGRLGAVAAKPALLELVARLVGATVELYADQALLKPPLIGREKPWHQDHAFFDLPMGTPIVGCWIALDQAAIENGCMHVIPRTHRDGPVVHFKRRDFQICDTSVRTGDIVAVPLEPGGALFWNGLLHHGTPATRSSRRRQALQLHYIPAGTARTTKEERLAVFGADGKDVSC